MVDKFWETVVGELAKRWAALAATAAAVFWVAGVAAWALGHEDGFSRIDRFFEHLDTFTQVALAIGALTLVFGSAYVMDLIAPIVLRVLEGDLPASGCIATRLYGRAAENVRTKRASVRQEYLELLKKGDLAASESRRAAALDRELHNLPIRDADVRLTAFGNLMSASQVRPLLRFGLDPDVAWPAFWLILPDSTRTAFQSARGSVDSALRALVWGGILAVWAIWTFWAFAAAVFVVLFAYWTLRRRAEAFGEISEAAFALYRFDLYAALGFKPPSTPDQDRETGEQVTLLLWRGTMPPELPLHPPAYR